MTPKQPRKRMDTIHHSGPSPAPSRFPGYEGLEPLAPPPSRPARSRASHNLYSVDQVRKGLPIRALDDLAGVLKVDSHDLANVLGTSVRTLQRKAGDNDRLAPAASDRLARIRRILDLATHVFGEPDKASLWLTSVSRPLGGEMPLHMLDTDMGTQRVEQELRQIEFGMPV